MNNDISKLITYIENSIVEDREKCSFLENKISGATKYFVEMEDDFSSSDIKNIKFQKNTFSGNGKFYIYKNELTLKQFVEKYKLCFKSDCKPHLNYIDYGMSWPC